MPRKYWHFILNGRKSIPYTELNTLMIDLMSLLIADRGQHTIQIIEE